MATHAVRALQFLGGNCGVLAIEEQAPIPTIEPTGVSIYPNPANQRIYLRCPSDLSLVKTSVFSAEGKRVFVSETTHTEISTARLANGCYVVELLFADQRIARYKVNVIH